MARDATILLAEDESADVFLMRRALLKAGISNLLCVVRDGEEAVEYIRGIGKFADRKTHPIPAILLLDLNMPKKSGFEVLEWVRAESELKGLPIIVLSTSNQERDIRMAYNLGANSYLTKPSNFDQLVEMVRMVEANWLRMNIQPPNA